MERNTTRAFWSRFSKLVAVVTLCLVTSSCLLRITGGFVFTDDVSTFVRLALDGVSVALCRDQTDEQGITTNQCTYRIQTEDGAAQSISTVKLLSEFGLFGLLVDPVIMQVPQGSVVEIATVDDGFGPQSLRITETAAFAIQPGTQAHAQTGHVFWIIELPIMIEQGLATAPAELDYTFDFNVPQPPGPDNRIPLRMMLAGRVESGGDTFYVPLYPCTNEFSEVPEIRIPVTADLFGFIFDLLFQFGEQFGNPDRSCMDKEYDFTAIPNDPPIVNAGPGDTIDEGEAFTRPGSFTDADSASWTATVDYGDGAGPEGLALNPDRTFVLSHVYVNPGLYDVTVAVTDDAGAVGIATVAVSVNPAAPVTPVTDLAARAKSGKVQLVWTHVGADSYNVYRSVSIAGPYGLIDSTTSTYSTYADTDVVNGTTYYYRVTSVVGGAESLQSNDAAATPRSRRRR